MLVKIHKTTTLPGTLEPDAIYLVAPATPPAGFPNYMEVYTVNAAGDVARRTPTFTEINALIDSKVSGLGAMQIVTDIAARDALALTANAVVFVGDASADPTVDAGAATYVWDQAAGSFSKIAEHESLDLVLSWSDLVGGPNSSPAAIDVAVGNSHSHANATELSKVGEDEDGVFQYDGKYPCIEWTTAAW